MMKITKGQFIRGNWSKHPDSAEFSVKSPINGELYSTGYLSTSSQIDEAVSSAVDAFPLWKGLPVADRSECIQSFISRLKIRAEEISEVISWEIGKPLWESKTEVGALAGKLEPSLKALEMRGKSIEFDQPGGAQVTTRFVPIGVCAVVAPFNFPLHMPNGHIIPALLAGNTIVFKPSPAAPIASELYIKCWEESDIPDGVLNMVHASAEGSNYLVQHQQVDGVFFTGSFNVGRKIYDSVGPDTLVALEMGGDSATIVVDTPNRKSAVVSLMQSAFITSGQRCSSSRRLIVLDNAENRELISELARATRKIRVGLPFDEKEAFIGPMRSSSAADAALKEQETLVAKGGKSLVKCTRSERCDALISPGVIEMPANSTDTSKELLAPLLRLYWVESIDEAISEANQTEFGLAAGVVTEDDDIFKYIEERLEVGNINRNQATTGNSAWGSFGGTRKSGNFRPSGFLATDYCVRAVATFERKSLPKIEKLPVGLEDVFLA